MEPMGTIETWSSMGIGKEGREEKREKRTTKEKDKCDPKEGREEKVKCNTKTKEGCEETTTKGREEKGISTCQRGYKRLCHLQR